MSPLPSSGSLSLTLKPEVSYRVKKIEVKRGDAIDRIKITYDDGTVWSNGHDGGKADSRAAVMTAGEYLVRVTHERFENYKCAAAAIEFVTNKGRVFAYHPPSMATRWAKEQTTVEAEPGKEIIALTIRQGVLVGSEQQDAPLSEQVAHPKEWFVLASAAPKEDDDTAAVEYHHFHTKAAAVAAWKHQGTVVSVKRGRATVLIDCIHLRVVKRAGDADGVQVCTARATEAGFCASSKDEDASVVDAVMMLLRVLNQKRDIWMFFIVMLLLGASFYLELEAQLLT